MRIRTARAILQRLALIGGLCAGAWCAAEGLDHGTAWADDPPIRIEQEAAEQPGGLLNDQPSRTPDTEIEQPRPPAEPTPPRPDPDPPGRPDDDEQTAEPDRPRSDDDAGAVDTPDPTDGDDGRPQHPVDTPSDPGPTDPPPPAVTPDLPVPDVELPADPDPRPTTPPADEVPNTGEPVDPPVDDEPVTEQPEPVPPAGGIEADHPLFGGEHQPAPYVPVDVQTRSWGEPVCDSRDDRGTPVTDDRSGTRDRMPSPRGASGPEPQPLDNPCDPDDDGGTDPTPATPAGYSGDHALPGPFAMVRVWVLDLHRDALGHDRHDDRLPPSRLTLWPPGPG